MDGLDLHKALSAVLADGRPRAAGPLSVGLETRTTTDYYWDGLKRGISERHPVAVLQYTLDGWGVYSAGGVNHRVGAGRMFVAIVPSEHVYFLPAESGRWTFFWVIVRHGYIVQRLEQTQRQCGPVIEVPTDSALMASLMQAWRDTAAGTFRDDLAAEHAAFSLMVEYERFAHHLLHPAEPRQRLLDETRRYVLQHLGRNIEVEDLARRHQMTRSHFSHFFRARTGMPPARFIVQTRLEEARRLLVHGDEKLQAIARRCGFAGANHFSKVFRRYHHMSPGEYRKQMG